MAHQETKTAELYYDYHVIMEHGGKTFRKSSSKTHAINMLF